MYYPHPPTNIIVESVSRVGEGSIEKVKNFYPHPIKVNRVEGVGEVSDLMDDELRWGYNALYLL